MNKFLGRNFIKIQRYDHGFSLVEVVTVVVIVGILSSLSIPSFLAWRRNQIVKSYFDNLRIQFSSFSAEAKKWGATCTLKAQPNSTGSPPFTFNCISNGSQKSLSKCGSAINCNISNLNTLFDQFPANPRGDSLVYVLANKENHLFTPRGQLSGVTDSLVVIAGTRALGGSTVRRCIVIKNITAEIRTGLYVATTVEPSSGASSVRSSLNPAYCRIS